MLPPADGTAPEAQQILTPLTSAAIFLVVTTHPGPDSDAAMRSICGEVGALVRSVGFRALDANLTGVMGIGSEAWDRIVSTGTPGIDAPAGRPEGLHPFVEITAGPRHAPSTPGDLLFHIRATRFDVCFELAVQILARLGPAVESADEVHGFRYFDARDLLGFVDGTENPVGDAMAEATIIGPEEPEFAGGSYVIVQKYLHHLEGWNALSTEEQERVIGRTKLADIELDDSVKPTSAHNALTVIEVDGQQVDILRDNMPFANAAAGEFGTYFIGYARAPWVTEQMLKNMFVGRPEGNYDRILDFSTATTGTLFFVPSLPLLESLAEVGATGGGVEPLPDAAPGSTTGSASDGSLRIGGRR